MFKGGVFLRVAIVLGTWATVTEIHSATNVSHRFNPVLRPFSDEMLQHLHVPPGFRVNVFARGQGNARMLISLPDGTILMSRYDVGQVVAYRDTNSDGVADTSGIVASVPLVHGFALRDNTVYLASETKLLKMAIGPDGTFGTPVEFAQLPPGGLHPRRTIGFDRAGWLYVSVGSSCNNCGDVGSPEYATMVRMKPDGTERTVWARGLRNAIGFAWHPSTHRLWAWDNGSDDRGDTIPSEELNLLEEGKHYGWPSCYGRRVVDRIALQDESIVPIDCSRTRGMVRGYRAHSAPVAFVFYNGRQFPSRYRHDGFVAFHGSWNRENPAGYKVVRVRFRHGRPMGFQDFVRGWLIENGQAQFGRPAGLVVARDGSMLITDDNNGTIYRVSYHHRR
jgi:glucose/arabinose dehydrogenase